MPLHCPKEKEKEKENKNKIHIKSEKEKRNKRKLLVSKVFHNTIHTNILFEIANSLNLDLSSSINPVLTWYVDNSQDANSVIDLIFLCTKSEKFDNHQIMLELHSSPDYASLSVSITIKEEYIQERKQIIIKNNEKEKRFINELRDKINNINTSNILNSETLERLTQKITTIAEDL